ncbi:MAG: hypothetical protein M1308_13995 [Actinobacteria bacterium]|nr:hypothetical protein [Actinomycetota bacterium]
MNILKKLDKNKIISIVAIVGVIAVAALIFGKPNISALIGGTSAKEIAQKSVDYINNNGLSQTTATLAGEAVEESGLIKFKVKMGSNEFDSYATKDGKLLFPQVFNMGEKKDNKQTAGAGDTAKKTPSEVKKADSPLFEAYIVSRCPFGLQMQRIMADVVKSIPDMAKYMKVMYMGSVTGDGKNITAMHGEAEAKENLRQICIREEQANKYWEYASCQMKASGTEVSCEKSTGVDSAKLNACMSDPNRGVAYAKKDFDGQNKYNVTGSPTLVLNESNTSEFDFGGRNSEAIKSMVCAAFNSQPSFCSQKLNTTDAATSFSATYSAAGSTGSTAPSANSGSGCHAAQ